MYKAHAERDGRNQMEMDGNCEIENVLLESWGWMVDGVGAVWEDGLKKYSRPEQTT